MILSTMDAVLGLSDDVREEALELSDRGANLCLNDDDRESAIGTREF